MGERFLTMRGGLWITALLVVALSTLQVDAEGRFVDESQVLMLASEAEGAEPAQKAGNTSNTSTASAAPKQTSSAPAAAAKNTTRTKVGHVLQKPPVKAKAAGKDAHFKSEVAKAAKELVDKTRKKGRSVRVGCQKEGTS